MKLTKTNLWRIGTLFAFISITGALSVSHPNILTDNTFLKELMGPDLVSVLVVTLTITFASVSNIHLSITRMISIAADKEAAAQIAGRVRREIDSNAWTIFWALLVALFALIVYGASANEPILQALAIAVCLSVILLNGLVMHDIYRSIFMLVANEPTNGA